MKFSFLVFLILAYLHPPSNESYLQRVRANYILAANDRKICATMIQELAKNEDNAVIMAYLGGYKAIWAKHIINPFSKLSTFRKGTELIEKAVMNDRTNVEIRFIRLSIQKNCPFFLSYKKNIDEDTKFINANKNNIKSEHLRNILDNMNHTE